MAVSICVMLAGVTSWDVTSTPVSCWCDRRILKILYVCWKSLDSTRYSIGVGIADTDFLYRVQPSLWVKNLCLKGCVTFAYPSPGLIHPSGRNRRSEIHTTLRHLRYIIVELFEIAKSWQNCVIAMLEIRSQASAEESLRRQLSFKREVDGFGKRLRAQLDENSLLLKQGLLHSVEWVHIFSLFQN